MKPIMTGSGTKNSIFPASALINIWAMKRPDIDHQALCAWREYAEL